jgi:hypothetical protein
MFVRNVGGPGCSFHIIDVGLHKFLAAIFHRTDADNRGKRDDGATHHRLLEILLIIFRESGDLLLEQLHFHIRTDFKPLKSFPHIGKEARLGKFAIGNDVDAAIGLLADHLRNRFAQRLLIRCFVIRIAGIFGLHRIKQNTRSRQASDMGRLNTVGILLDRHGALLAIIVRRFAASYLMKRPLLHRTWRAPPRPVRCPL